MIQSVVLTFKTRDEIRKKNTYEFRTWLHAERSLTSQGLPWTWSGTIHPWHM